MSELRLLQKFKEAIGQGLRDGLSAEETRLLVCEQLDEKNLIAACEYDRHVKKAWATAMEFKTLLAGNGNLLDSVIRAGMARANRAGRWRAFQRKAAAGGRHLVQYLSNDNCVACGSHRALNGMVRPHDDPVWRDCWPPIGIGCECEVSFEHGTQDSAEGLRPTPDDQTSAMLNGLQRDQTAYPPFGHHLIPFADALTKSFKEAEIIEAQHRSNAAQWSRYPGLDEALRERYIDGVDVFAAKDHSVSSRGEISIDIAVLPKSLPRYLGGQVISITDSGYKQVYRRCIWSLNEIRKTSKAKTPFLFTSSDSDLRETAAQIMKNLPLFDWPDGQILAVARSAFLVAVIEEKVWIHFQFKHDKQLGIHRFELIKALYFRKGIRDIIAWNRQTRGNGDSELSIHKLKKGPGNTPEQWLRYG